jgi:hypothetical protein
MKAKEAGRALARRLGIGKAIMKWRHVRHIGIRSYAVQQLARSRFLELIRDATPIAVGGTRLGVHMLLHHKRLLEGIWTLYSFVYFAGADLDIVIHSDGSLTPEDEAAIRRVLPGTRIISREVSDQIVETALTTAGYQNCLRLRRTLKFGIKLIDVRFFAKAANVVILDSDVLFYARPNELIDDLDLGAAYLPGPARYSLDIADNYCLPEDALVQALGGRCISRFNPGVMRVPADAPSLSHVERFLNAAEFWTLDGNASYFAELSCWAMDLTLRDAAPLSDGYVLAPRGIDDRMVAGHFCGGPSSALIYYTAALPALARRIGLR